MTTFRSPGPSFPLSRLSLLWTLFFALFVGATGCKKSESAKNDLAVPSGSASAATGGPCEQYAQKICDKAGENTPTCASFKTAAELMSTATCSAGLKDIEQSFSKLTAMRGTCEELVKKLCGEIGEKTETCEMVKTQTQKFPAEQCKEMLKQLPEIVADLQKMERARAPLDAALAAKIIQGPVPSLGPENAAVQIVEFSDFECPYCSKAATTVHQIREKYGDKVRIVFRQFPLSFHQNAHLAAQASLAAAAQGKFWPYHDLLFKNQQALDRASLENHAKEAQLNLGEFKKSLDEKKYAPQVDADLKLGAEVNVQGTPTMFINGKRVANPSDFDAVASLIDSELGGPTKG